MIGTIIQNYQITSLLGEGGMGTVYMATDNLLGRNVAIKNLNASLTRQPQFLERFKNEAKTLARLSHPNIALLYNYLQNGEDYYMVMEYVEGENIDQLIRKNKSLPFQVVVPIICRALEGLAHAHAKDILHRDIKPANIMLSKEYNIKLMDFGIAKVSDAVKLTRASRVIGTIEYLAPELIEGKEPSVSSDIYAIGITMYEMLTGKLPFSGKSDYMLMQDILKEKPPALQKLNGTIPKKLADIVSKALEKKPEKRFSSAKEFLQALASSFPELKEIDPQYLLSSIAASNIFDNLDGKKAPAPTAIISQPGTTIVDVEKARIFAKPANVFSILKNKYLYIAVASLFLVFVLFKIFLHPTPAPAQIADNGNGQNDVTTDSIANQQQTETQQSYNTSSDSINFIVNKTKEEANKQKEANTNDAGKDANIRQVEEKKPKKQEEKEVSNVAPKPKPKPKPEPDAKPEPLPKPEPEPATTLSSPVNLRTAAIISLRENVTPETAQDGQPVSFKVQEPVEMKGQMIIPAGSVIYGNIKKIGRIRMDIIFNSVSIHGRSIRLERSESSGNIRDVLSPGNSFKIGLRGTLAP